MFCGPTCTDSQAPALVKVKEMHCKQFRVGGSQEIHHLRYAPEPMSSSFRGVHRKGVQPTKWEIKYEDSAVHILVG